MEKTHFYICDICGNIVTATNVAPVTCCGKGLLALQPNDADVKHTPVITESDGDLILTFPHAMTKEHFLDFVVYLGYGRTYFVRLYPEQDAEVRIPFIGKGKLYVHCNLHGFLEIAR